MTSEVHLSRIFLFKVVFLTLLAGIQNMCKIMLILTVITVRHKLLNERITLIQRINRCPAIRKTDVLIKLWKFRQNTYKNSRIWCSRIVKHRSIDFIIRFVGEIKEPILCLPLFIFIIYYCKALRFLAILSIVWEIFSLAVSWWSLSCPQ